MIELTIPIEPKAQTRPKFGRGGAYEDPKMKAWRNSATYLIKRLSQGRSHVLSEGTSNRIEETHTKS